MSTVPANILLGTPKEAAAYIHQVRDARKASPSLAKALDEQLLKQAYGWEEFKGGLGESSPLSYGLAGAGGGGLLAALNEMRHKKKHRNWWNVLKGMGIGGALGAGGAKLNKALGVSKLLTQPSNEPTPENETSGLFGSPVYQAPTDALNQIGRLPGASVITDPLIENVPHTVTGGALSAALKGGRVGVNAAENKLRGPGRLQTAEKTIKQRTRATQRETAEEAIRYLNEAPDGGRVTGGNPSRVTRLTDPTSPPIVPDVTPSVQPKVPRQAPMMQNFAEFIKGHGGIAKAKAADPKLFEALQSAVEESTEGFDHRVFQQLISSDAKATDAKATGANLMGDGVPPISPTSNLTPDGKLTAEAGEAMQQMMQDVDNKKLFAELMTNPNAEWSAKPGGYKLFGRDLQQLTGDLETAGETMTPASLQGGQPIPNRFKPDPQAARRVSTAAAQFDELVRQHGGEEAARAANPDLYKVLIQAKEQTPAAAAEALRRNAQLARFGKSRTGTLLRRFGNVAPGVLGGVLDLVNIGEKNTAE